MLQSSPATVISHRGSRKRPPGRAAEPLGHGPRPPLWLGSGSGLPVGGLQLDPLGERQPPRPVRSPQVLGAMRSQTVSDAPRDQSELVSARERLQRQLNSGEIAIETFSRAWRGLDRPKSVTQGRPDELRLRRAGKPLSEFGTLSRNPAVPTGFGRRRSARSSAVRRRRAGDRRRLSPAERERVAARAGRRARAAVAYARSDETGRGERASPDTPSPILLIPVTTVPSYVHRASEIA